MDPALALEAEVIARHRNLGETIARGDSRVQRFYAGAVVFVTGGSGFLGKQLIEKLFRSCAIEKVYILLRPKKKKTIEERIKQIFGDPNVFICTTFTAFLSLDNTNMFSLEVTLQRATYSWPCEKQSTLKSKPATLKVFEELRKIKPDFKEKIIPVMGDVTKIGLGISQEEWNTLTEEVTMIFHGAATINFVEPLRVAVLTNIRGTRDMIILAKACKKLKSFVHISTAYCHATYQRIGQPVKEQFYECPVPPNVILQLVDCLDDEKLDAITPKLIKNWPNTYAFTKAIGEELVRIMGEDLPVSIVRPAIVIAASREPTPGWIDKSCAFGPTGLILGAGLGIIHVMYFKGDICTDLVPVDLVNNAVIVAAHETAAQWERGETKTQIYTVTGTRNPILFGEMSGKIALHGRNFPTDKAVYYAFSLETSNKLMFVIMTWLFHYIPGYLIDGLLKTMGKKPILIKLYTKVKKLNEVLGYFTTNEWIFDDSNLLKLYWSLSPADRTIFNCNMISIDWNQYLTFWCIGSRKYIIEDGLNKTDIAIKKQFWFRILNVVVMSLYGFALYKMLCLLYLGIVYLLVFFKAF